MREKGWGQTEFGDEEEEHDDGGGEGNDAAREGSAVEILIDLRVRVQAPNLAHYILHLFVVVVNPRFSS